LRILFVTEKRVNAGSIQAVANYIAAGDRLGHTVAVYGSPDPAFPSIRFSIDADRFDFVVFILESKLDWLSGLRVARILSAVPRERRAVLDADGLYNDWIVIEDYDRNHGGTAGRDRWREACERLGSRIFQPTLAPRDPRVKPLLFYGSALGFPDRGLSGDNKALDLIHVGHNWWRWKELEESFFPAISRVRKRIGEICFLGLWWDGCPRWAGALGLRNAFHVEPERLRDLRIMVRPPVPFTQVVATMSSARINLMTQRPLFQKLRILTSKYFEILCADTIPLVLIPPDLAESVYGPRGRELSLQNGSLEQRLLSALEQPACYREVVEQVRDHVRTHHSYQKRVEQLVAALES
jgi:hypothetical protein